MTPKSISTRSSPLLLLTASELPKEEVYIAQEITLDLEHTMRISPPSRIRLPRGDLVLRIGWEGKTETPPSLVQVAMNLRLNSTIMSVNKRETRWYPGGTGKGLAVMLQDLDSTMIARN